MVAGMVDGQYGLYLLIILGTNIFVQTTLVYLTTWCHFVYNVLMAPIVIIPYIAKRITIRYVLIDVNVEFTVFKFCCPGCLNRGRSMLKWVSSDDGG